MKAFGRFAILFSASGLIGGCATVDADDNSPADLAIENVNVVDVQTGAIARNRTIVIDDGTIVSLSWGPVGPGRAERIIDAKGAFAVPGFNDMHAHNLNTGDPATSLPLMVAYGVTGFRQMAPAAPQPPEEGDRSTQLPPLSPTVLAMPGPLLAGPAFANPANSAAEVRRQKEAGVDFVKIVDLPRPAFLAALDAAQGAGLATSGHLAPSVTPREALAHGMDSIEHLGPTISILLSCSRDEDAIRAMMASAPQAPPRDIDFNMPPERIARLLANPALLTPPQGFALIRRVLDTYDETKCRALAEDIADSDTWVVPTLTRLEAMGLGNSADLRDNSDLQLVPARDRSLWREVGEDFATKLSLLQQQVLADLFERQLVLAGLFAEEGVKMMVGTDFGGQWIAPGASLHREFDLLAQGGVAPLRILQMATIDPARYLGRSASMGTVAPGHAADLVLLSADPTKSAANLHAISGVVRAGAYLDRGELDAIVARSVSALRR